MLTEDDLEQLCLGWFAEQGWEIHHGPDIAPDGSNPHLPADVFEQVISRITRAESPDLIASNKTFHHWLLEGFRYSTVATKNSSTTTLCWWILASRKTTVLWWSIK